MYYIYIYIYICTIYIYMYIYLYLGTHYRGVQWEGGAVDWGSII